VGVGWLLQGRLAEQQLLVVQHTCWPASCYVLLLSSMLNMQPLTSLLHSATRSCCRVAACPSHLHEQRCLAGDAVEGQDAMDQQHQQE
jgi:hypothetical protein